MSPEVWRRSRWAPIVDRASPVRLASSARLLTAPLAMRRAIELMASAPSPRMNGAGTVSLTGVHWVRPGGGIVPPELCRKEHNWGPLRPILPVSTVEYSTTQPATSRKFPAVVIADDVTSD